MAVCTIKTTLRTAFVLVLFPLFILASTSHACAQQSRELVVIIDISTSMHDLFDEAKGQAQQFVSSAQIGDRVTLITFGESAHLIERSRIRSSYNIARIISIVDELEATEYSTNLPGGMERGLREMRQFYEEDPDNTRILMWLSDDKNNPPKDISNVITFTSLKQQHTGELPDHSWFEFEAPIESEVDSDVQWFIDWVSRSKMKLSVELLAGNLGTLLSPDLERDVRVRFTPSTEAVMGTTFSVVAEVTAQGGKPYSEAIPVFPSEIVCRVSPWEQDLRLMFPDRPGQYICRISLVLPSDKLLVISPPQLSLEGKVQAQIKKIQRPAVAFDEAIAAGYRESRKTKAATQRAMAMRERVDLTREARASPPKTRLLFGPIAARGQYRVTASLTPTRNLTIDSIRMKSSLKLPRGLVFEPEYRIADGKLFADLFLAATEDLDLDDGWEMKGLISFVSSEKGIKIYPDSIPVKLYAKKGASRWGKRELETAATYEQLSRVFAVTKGYALKVAKWLLVLAGVWVLYQLIRRYIFGMTELVGSLEVLKNPTGKKMKSVNLKRMGKFKAANSLTVGSNRKSDIALSHDSMADWHAKITTARTEAGTVVFVQPLHNNEILVNDVAYTRRKEIGDRDILSIGDFTFLYRCPDVQRQTIVRFTDGRSIRGVLVSWDIDSPTFEFLPKDAPSMDARMVIEFSELKAVFFVRKKSRFSVDRFFASTRASSGRPVEIIFSDGELQEGYMVGEANEWSKRFYLIPKELGEIALVLVERSAVQNIFMRDAFEKQPVDLVGAVRGFLNRNGL